MTAYIKDLHHDQVLPAGYKWEEIQVPVPWGYISGKWWGSRDRQPVLAIHGWQDNAGTFDRLIPLLPVDMSFFCIDLPGHGKSSHFPKGIHYHIFWDGIDIIRRIAKYFEWQKITLMGHSLGGALSFMYASCFPDEITGYVSIDIASPTVRDPGRMASMTGGAIDKFLEFEGFNEEKSPCYDYDSMLDIVQDAHKGSITRESAKVLMRRGTLPFGYQNGIQTFKFTRDLRLKVALLGMMSLEQVLEYAKLIKCRILNIRALPGMKWDKPEYYSAVIEALRESVPDMEYVEVEGTHHVHLNDPEKVSSYITEFLQY